MEMKREARLIGWIFGFGPLGVQILYWIIFDAWLFRNITDGPWILTSIVVAGTILSLTMLSMMGYVRRLRTLPRPTDLPITMTALTFAIGLQYALIISLDQGNFPSFDPPMLEWMAGTTFAIVAYFSHFFRQRYSLEKGIRKKKVVLELLPTEREELLVEFRAANMHHFLEYLTPSDLKEHFLTRKEHEIDQIIISRGASRHFHDDAYLVRAHLSGIPIVDRKELSADLTGRIRLLDSDSWSFVLTATMQTPLLRLYAHFKVWAEPLLAFILAIPFIPLMVGVAIAIKSTSKGPVFYRQRRTGYLGKPFYLVKFRSMGTDSESNGVQWAKSEDDRVTPVGKFIRKTRLDELPQFWNVIRREMSFFGPRPERPEFYTKLKQDIPLFNIRTSIRPGITGWAQVHAGYAASVEESKTKLEYDLYYIKHVSPRLDGIIFVQTFMVAFMGSEKVERKASPHKISRKKPKAS